MVDVSTEALQTVKNALTTFQADIEGIALRSANNADAVMQECKAHIGQAKSEIAQVEGQMVALEKQIADLDAVSYTHLKAAPTVTENRDPEVVAWEKDEITSFEVKVVEIETPGVEKPEASSAPKHRLTPEEKQIKDAVMDKLKAQIAQSNDGMLATYRASAQSFKVMLQHGVRIEGNTVTQNGEPLFAIHRRHSTRKTQGCYRELTPTLEVPTNIKGKRSRLAFFCKNVITVREFTGCNAYTQPDITVDVYKRQILYILLLNYPYQI